MFTYIVLLIEIIGLILAFIPTQWYEHSKFDYRVIGIWMILLSGGTWCSVMLIRFICECCSALYGVLYMFLYSVV